MWLKVLDATSSLVAVGALVAWLARELSFRQRQRQWNQFQAILIGENSPKRPCSCLFQDNPFCAMYKPSEHPEQRSPE